MNKHTLLSAALLLTLVACQKSTTVTRRPADIRGRITGLIPPQPSNIPQGIRGFIRVEGALDTDTKFDKAAITITDSTMLLLRTATGEQVVLFESLQEGDSVEANFTGPVLESYPVQVKARDVLVLERKR